MSVEKERQESERWLQQARADLRAAEGSLQLGSFEWACFQSQQAGEKALKAFWYYHGEDPWGHSVAKLIDDFPIDPIRSDLARYTDLAKALDKLYIPTRYPNGLPDLTPSEAYTETEARSAIDAARTITHYIAAQMN